jgi:hypothetical protein
MCNVIFSTTCSWRISHCKNNSVRRCHKCENVIMWSACNSCRILIKIEFSWRIFKKTHMSNFIKNTSSGSRVVLCGQTNGQKDITRLIIAFRSFANTFKKANMNTARLRFALKDEWKVRWKGISFLKDRKRWKSVQGVTQKFWRMKVCWLDDEKTGEMHFVSSNRYYRKYWLEFPFISLSLFFLYKSLSVC